MSVLLSVLIPTLPRRRHLLAELLAVLEPQRTPALEILTHEDDGALKIGAKRNAMMRRARGQYVAHIDDDDLLAPDFFATVAPALADGVDLVAYDAGVSFNGSPEFRVTTRLGAQNEQPCHIPGGYSDIVRTPWTWCCWKTTLARAYSFPEDRNWGEDALWLAKVLPAVTSHRKIDRVLFHHRWSAAVSTSSVET